MVKSYDAEERLKQLQAELSKNEKRLKSEIHRIGGIIKKAESLVAKQKQLLKNNEQRIHAWMIQRSHKFEDTVVLKNYQKFNKYGEINTNAYGWPTETKIGTARNFIKSSVEHIEKSIELQNHPTLHNLFLRRSEIKGALEIAVRENEAATTKEVQIKLDFETEARALNKKIDQVNRSKHREITTNRKSSIPKMNIENWEDAEIFVVKYMRWLGFGDAQKTGSGSDEGKDVDSSKAVAQVKDMGTGVSRPMLQQLFGVAAAEKKIPVFFARSYAKTAREWGDKHGMVLFQFSIRGDVKAVSTKAEQILKKKSS